MSALIKEQFPHVDTLVVQAVDMRNAPSNWFIAVERRNALVEKMALHIHNRQQWQEALTALYVLREF